MSEAVRIEIDENIARVTLNRPDVFNVLDKKMARDLATGMIEISASQDAKVVLISGSGKAFSAGGDLKFFADHPDGIGTAIRQTVTPFHTAILEIRRMSKPVVGMINGVAAGGGLSLALACDFRVMAGSALLKLGYPSVGLCPDGGSTWALVRMVGLPLALELAALDEPISAERALEYRLVNKVVEDKDLWQETESLLAQRLAHISSHAFGWSKRLFDDAYSATLESQLESERRGIAACGSHRDGCEGIRAFIEKQPPFFGW